MILFIGIFKYGNDSVSYRFLLRKSKEVAVL